VKICSLYGAGFYYIPGTDMCLKIGGWVRQYTTYGTNGNSTNGGLIDNVNTRATGNFEWRSRGYITADARNQTEFGTVRSYIAVGLNSEYAGAPGSATPPGLQTFNSNRAFIQWAGFTFGLAQSFFDFYSGPATSYWGGKINPSEDTGDGGQQVWAYTAQFGNGFSATIAAEGPRTQGVWGTGVTTATTTGITFAGQAEGTQWPDIVGNLRIDQAWGSAQIMGAIHNASGQYYAASQNSGHPGDVIGFAVGGGIKLNAPMIGPGDYLQAEVNYTQGAVGYLNAGSNARYASYNGDGTYGSGMLLDSVYGGAGTSVQLTTGWGVNAAYEHFWNAHWKTSVYGGYQQYTFNDNANAAMCAGEVTGGFVAGVTQAQCVGAGNNWGVWDIGSRTQWNVTKDFYLGVDVVYQNLNTQLKGLTGTVAGSGAQPTAVRTFDDQHSLMVQFRAHKDFYP
jgi:hypothetical protein